MKNILKWLDRHLEEVILVAATIVLVLVIFFQVLARYFLNQSLAWSEELARYVFVWSVWLAVPYTVTRGRHIRLEILPDIVGPKAKFVLDMGFCLGSGIGFTVATLYVAEGQRKIRNRDVPGSFKGLPVTLLYIGILSLCIYSFTGYSLGN